MRSLLDFRRYNNSTRDDRQHEPTFRITAPENSAAQCWCAKHLCGNSFQIWLMRLPESSVQGLSLDCLKACFLLALQSCTVTDEKLIRLKQSFFFFFPRVVFLVFLSRFPHVCSHCPRIQQQIPEGHTLFPGTRCALQQESVAGHRPPLNHKQASRGHVALFFYPQL